MLRPFPFQNYVPQGQGITNTASPKVPLRGLHKTPPRPSPFRMGVSASRSPSRPRLPHPGESMSTTPEPISDERDKTRGKASQRSLGATSFNVCTYPTQGCRCIVVTRPQSCQRFTNMTKHVQLYTHAVCQPLTGHVRRRESKQALGHKLHLARRIARPQDKTPPCPSLASATCSPAYPVKGHSFKLWRASSNLRTGSVATSGGPPPHPSSVLPSISVT
jgi:hypothetical protein